MNNNNIEFGKSQDENLVKELETRFVPKRLSSEVLADSYSRLGFYDKFRRVSECGTLLEFRKPVGSDSVHPSADPLGAAGGRTSDRWKLHNANFCRDRLCPMCAWRRTYKIFSQISQIMNIIDTEYCFLFLTLTVPNCSSEDLPKVLDELQIGWKKFIKYKRFSVVKGFFKALEITRNTDNCSKSFNTYHPHYHVILAVSKSYFVSSDYIKRDEWLDLWQRAMQNKFITQVDIRRCKAKKDISEGEQALKSLGSAVAEVAKYSVKASDYLGRYKDGFLVSSFSDIEIDSAVSTLSSALRNRRLCALGGVFKLAQEKLGLDDCEDGDLIHLEGSEIRSDVAYMILRYSWSAGTYKLLDERTGCLN